jgi:hypothetical protein
MDQSDEAAQGVFSKNGLINAETLHVDWEDNYPIARLFADRYAEIVSIRRHSIPTPDQIQHNED